MGWGLWGRMEISDYDDVCLMMGSVFTKVCLFGDALVSFGRG